MIGTRGLIVLTSVYRYVAAGLNIGLGVGRFAFVAFDLVFVALWLRPNLTLLRRHAVVYIFCLLVFTKSAIGFLASDPTLASFYLNFSIFRRVALPFAVLVYFSERLVDRRAFQRIVEFLYKWFVVVALLQSADFILMQLSDTYVQLLTAAANSFEEIFTRDMLSHIFVFKTQPLRAHGLGLNYHSSGLYALMLYAFNLKLRSTMPLWLHLAGAVAILASGSVQFLGLYLLLLVVSRPVVYRHKWSVLLLALFAGVIVFRLAVGYTLPYLGTLYLFEYTELVAQELFSHFVLEGNLRELFWGVGGLSATGQMWTVGYGTLELGDIGIIRLILEGGLVLWIGFFAILTYYVVRYVLPYRSNEPAPMAGAVLAIGMGMVSLVHYPVLFTTNNIVLFMLWFAIMTRRYEAPNSRKGMATSDRAHAR